MSAGLAIRSLPAADPLREVPGLANELGLRWLVWDACTAGERRVDLHPIVLHPAMHAHAIEVAERAARFVDEAADRAAADPKERALYNLHPDVEYLAESARAGRDRTRLYRVDLLLRRDGRFVACEVNADCPGGHNETIALPRLARAAGFRSAWDPSTVASDLADKLVELSGGPGSPRGMVALLCATAYAEDLQVCALVERMVKERGGRARRMPATAPALAADGEGVAYRGERIGVLYRFYPLEYMEEQRNIEALARATERGALASVSTFAAIHAQSKLAMARAWAHDPDAARTTFPETRAFRDVERATLLGERNSWVVKRDLSRVGDHVYVGALETDESFREVTDEIDEAELAGDVWIAQRYVPPMLVPTPPSLGWGPRCLTLGAYVFDGRFAGYLARLSKVSLCSHDALMLPVFVDGSEEASS